MPGAQAVAETVPAKTLTLGYQPQSHDGWLNEVSVHGLAHSGCFPFSFGEAKIKSSSLSYGVCCRQSARLKKSDDLLGQEHLYLILILLTGRKTAFHSIAARSGTLCIA